MSDAQTQLLQSLADKLGTSASALWGVLVQQAHIAVYLEIVDALTFAAVGYVLYRALRWIYGKRKEADDDFGPWIGIVLCAGGVILFFGLTISALESAVTAAINPEYWALDHVLSALRPKK